LTLNTPLESADVLDVAATAASTVVEPTLKSLGLASSFPGGFVQAGLEYLHIGCDMPWWSAIVLGSWLCMKTYFFKLTVLGYKMKADHHEVRT